MKKVFEQVVNSRLMSFLLLFSVFWILASASQSGFIDKWGFNYNERYGILKIIDMTADQPFVYRQLAPIIANQADIYIPKAIKTKIIKELSYMQDGSDMFQYVESKYKFRYIVIYYLSFFSLLTTLFIMYKILTGYGIKNEIAILSSALLGLTIPYLQTAGGYFYDNIELLFFSLSFLLASKGKAVLILALTIPATINKESFLFFIPTLYPLLKEKIGTLSPRIYLAVAIVIAGMINIYIKYVFSNNPGSIVEFHLKENFLAYLNPATYFKTELTYKIIGPAGLFFFTGLIVSLILIRGWQGCKKVVKTHFLIAASINIPLFIFWGYIGELRNLSMMFIGLTIILAYSISNNFKMYLPREDLNKNKP